MPSDTTPTANMRFITPARQASLAGLRLIAVAACAVSGVWINTARAAPPVLSAPSDESFQPDLNAHRNRLWISFTRAACCWATWAACERN